MCQSFEAVTVQFNRKGNSEKYTPVLFFALNPCKQIAENCVFLPAQTTKMFTEIANFRTTETVQKSGTKNPTPKTAGLKATAPEEILLHITYEQ